MEAVERQQASISNKLDRLINLIRDSDGGSSTTVKTETEGDIVVSLTEHTSAQYLLNAKGCSVA